MVVNQVLAELEDVQSKLLSDDPNYYAKNMSSLVTNSSATTYHLGTGENVLSAILPSIEAAESEVIFISCFWAKSRSRDQIGHSLRKLSARAVSQGIKIKVRIGFSSSSLFQKLLHTTSTTGKTWKPSTWVKDLGLPSMTELPGLDLQIKSIFVLPFSVMHPKFVIIDRKQVWLPSCNVSWEEWFEGGIHLSGDVVQHFYTFWQHFWGRDLNDTDSLIPTESTIGAVEVPKISGPAHAMFTLHDARHMPTLFLPSPHHQNPRFQPFAKQNEVRAPVTPLNAFLLKAISNATKTIYMQTPNVTAPPVLSALLAALLRGVNVDIVTSERLMIPEQLVTGGTTTSRCLTKLIKQWEPHYWRHHHTDPELGLRRPGRLNIHFFQAKSTAAGEPVQSHLKLTIIDEEWTVLGSGNMDRASWFTSQELGVAFQSPAMAAQIKHAVTQQLQGRLKVRYKVDGD